MTTRTISPVHLWIYMFLIIGGFSYLSCQKTSWSEDLTIEDKLETPPTSDAFLKNGPLDEAEILERKMQWASFISAKILCESQEARDEVVGQLLETHTDHIKISRLIVSEEYTPNFKSQFINWAYHYSLVINANGRPTHNEVIPPRPAASPIPGMPDSTDVYAYIDYLTQENCTELFFPNYLREGEGATIYLSTAHPMIRDADTNYGFERSCEDCDFGEQCVKEILIDDRQVRAAYDIIVCRPYRLTFGAACMYPQFENIDFTLFLNP